MDVSRYLVFGTIMTRTVKQLQSFFLFLYDSTGKYSTFEIRSHKIQHLVLYAGPSPKNYRKYITNLLYYINYFKYLPCFLGF